MKSDSISGQNVKTNRMSTTKNSQKPQLSHEKVSQSKKNSENPETREKVSTFNYKNFEILRHINPKNVFTLEATFHIKCL